MRTSVYNLMKEFNEFFMEGEATRGFLVDVLELENGFEVVADIPGFEKDDINITFEDGVLTIEATPKKRTGKYFIKERNEMKLKRVINFGDVSEDYLKAKYENGVLTVAIILKKPEVKETKKIVIE